MQRITRQSGDPGITDQPAETAEPTKAELLAAIHGARFALEHRIEAMAIDFNLIWANLQKVSDKVTAAESNISELQTEMKSIKQQMVQLKMDSLELER
ncbi:hypothetical protein NDU88_004030 [Pleurodeles waltl]|uniref:Uncharacterized protein n=1 Tax=Pleurodeles waltl TaxID=8319 RepID=A0AAV7WVC1_PLEWA|nr:hypothetical protein NDU88_004030 [Pleurodeles waltl]